jgi:microcystin-dependent protein
VVTKDQLDTKAELGGLNTQTFKSSAGVASDDVVTKAQLDTKAALGGSNAQTFKAAPGSASDDVPTKAQLDQIYSEQIGVIRTTAKISASSGWLFCNGSSILKTTYASLYALLTQSQGTVTMTIAAPCLVSLAAHGFDTGHSIFINTTGTLPTGLSQDVNYYVVKNNADSFWLATSRLNAIAGTKITTTGSQSGVHSLTFAPWGINGANSFYIPDFRGITLIGNGWNSLADMLEASGDQYHGFLGVYRQDQMQGHIHNGSSSAPAGGSGTTVWYSGGSTFNVSTPASDGVHGIPRTGDYTTGPFVGVNYEIKY